MNRKNLTKLLKALKSKKKLPAKFDMTSFSDRTSYYSQTCGSVGCLVGLSTYIIEPKRSDEYWVGYSYRIFDVCGIGRLWCFLFSSDWAINKKTNTKVHAIKRIEYVLKHGRAPEDWDYGWDWGIDKK